MLDKDVIAQLITDIGDDVFLRLSRQFLDETINRLATMASCREKQAWSELARHAHSLKSTAQSFGLKETGIYARDLQVAADHLDIGTIDTLLPPLIKIADRECHEFEAMRQDMSAAAGAAPSVP